jgi:biopolymer transport protein ExbD
MMFRRPRRAAHTIDMAPLIDVVFLLLVFFMLTSNFSPPSLPLELPQVRVEAVAEPQVVVVSLDAAGVLAIGGEVVEPDAFGTRLKEAMAAAASTTVHFRGDQSAGYGRFLSLMAEAKRAGAGSFHLVHSPEAE